MPANNLPPNTPISSAESTGSAEVKPSRKSRCTPNEVRQTLLLLYGGHNPFSYEARSGRYLLGDRYLITKDFAEIRRAFDVNENRTVGNDDLKQFIHELAEENTRNFLAEQIAANAKAHPWRKDDTAKVTVDNFFLNVLHESIVKECARNPDLKWFYMMQSRVWWASLVARALYPGYDNDRSLFLFGASGAGKTRLMRDVTSIFHPPEDLRLQALTKDEKRKFLDRSYTREPSVDLNNLRNLSLSMEDGLILVYDEASSISGSRVSEETSKKILTLQSMTYETKHEMSGTHKPLGFVQVINSNNPDLFRDPNMVRRILLVEVADHIDRETIVAILPQLWSEAYERFTVGDIDTFIHDDAEYQKFVAIQKDVVGSKIIKTEPWEDDVLEFLSTAGSEFTFPSLRAWLQERRYKVYDNALTAFLEKHGCESKKTRERRYWTNGLDNGGNDASRSDPKGGASVLAFSELQRPVRGMN